MTKGAKEGGSVYKLPAEVTYTVSEQLAEALLALIPDEEGVVNLDFTDVTAMDSSGLSVLLGLHARLERSGARLRILRPGQEIRELLECMRLTTRMDLAD